MLWAAIGLAMLQPKEVLTKVDLFNGTVHLLCFCLQLWFFTSGMVHSAEVKYEKQQYMEALEMEQQEWNDDPQNPKD